MHRIYCPSQDISAVRIHVSDKGLVHYLRDVLRVKDKEAITVFDGSGNEYRTQVESLSVQNITLKIKGKKDAVAGKGCSLTIACAVPKRSKLDDIIDKLTQLGVDRIIPLKTHHVIVRLNKHKEAIRRKRWEKIAQSASQQSQRNTLPAVDAVKDFRELLLEAKNFDLKLIPTLKGKRKSLKDILKDSAPKNILVAIGPEGDFSNQEVRLAQAAGFIPVSLGEWVLRVETAAVAVAGYLGISLGAPEHQSTRPPEEHK